MIENDIVSDLAPTGTLRAAINLGNPVLAQGTPRQPSGVTVELARELGARIGRPVEFRCVGAARQSFDALVAGQADIAFLAIEPARAEQVRFTAAYAVIEGVFVVAEESPLRSVADVDRSGVRVGVKLGSAYDLYLSRTLRHAELVRGDEGVDVFRAQGLEVGAGIRQPVERFVADNPGLRVIGERFMQIRQAVAVGQSRNDATYDFVRQFVEELKTDGSVAAWLAASGQEAQVPVPD